MDAHKFTKDLSDADLAALHDATKAEVKNRTPKFDIDSIKPGMTPEHREAARSAIRNALKDLYGS